MISITLDGCNTDDLARQVAAINAKLNGVQDVPATSLPLQELIEYTKARAAEQGFIIEISAPDVIEDEIAVVQADKIARRESAPALVVVPEISEDDTTDNDALKEETCKLLKGLYYEDGGVKILEKLRKQFKAATFGEIAADRFPEIAAALQEALSAREA
jgi:hypothetical protein